MTHSHIKQGTVTIGGKTFRARSEWEANIACYYEFLKLQGIIADWFHEPDIFWFNGIKRGVVSYTPDFKIIKPDGSFYYVEVKGYMDSKSRTKLKRMAKYHPQIKIELIDSKRYYGIAAYSGVYKGWGTFKNVLKSQNDKVSLKKKFKLK